jgi:hypothetical protein
VTRAALALGLFVCAAPAAAVEVRGVAPLAANATVQAGRQAAQAAAFAAAVDAAGRALLGRLPADAAKPAPDPAISAAIGSPTPFVSGYRLVRDEGVRPGAGGAKEYALVLDVQVDEAALRARLQQAGLLKGPPPLPESALRVVIASPPSYAAVTAVSQALRQLGAKRVVPESFEASRVVLYAVGPWNAATVGDRIAAAAPPGFALRTAATDEGRVEVAVDVVAAPPAPEAAGALSDAAAEPSAD